MPPREPNLLVSVSCSSQQERDVAIPRLAEAQIQMKQNQQEFRGRLRQIALLVARVEKRLVVNNEARGELAVPVGPSLMPSPPLQQRTTTTTVPLFAQFQTRIVSDVSGSTIACTGPQFLKYELEEGSNRSTETCNLERQQYEKIVKNGGLPFLQKVGCR